MSDKFFTQQHCDRCLKSPLPERTMSWFTDECICTECSKKEQDIKRALRAQGIDNAMEACGYLPLREAGLE